MFQPIYHVSVSPTDGNGPTQGQRKTLTRVGFEPTTFGFDHRCSTDWATRSDGSRSWEMRVRLTCPAWLFSLYLSLHHAWHEHSMWDPNLPLFQKMRRVIWSWDKTHEHEAIFFISFLLPLFQLMKLYVVFSCPCNIKRCMTINLNSYIALNYVTAWRNNFHAETIKFQDLSWNFSFQAVQIPL